MMNLLWSVIRLLWRSSLTSSMDTLFADDFDGPSQDTPIVQAANINAEPVS
ncbi:hypothetical protein Tco_1233007, partial [Tanacetum coccineum]